MKTLNVIEFIKSNENWMELLQQEPFNLSIKTDGDYALLKYSQLGNCDFTNPLIRECRGIIINVNTITPVCVPFFKFGNVQEHYADEIDWASARVLEKLDGSLMKLWYDDSGWRLSTNGTIDARNAELQSRVSVLDYYKKLENYHDLFMYAVKDLNWERVLNSLDKTMTYMFELVSPYNRIVVPYTETKLYHIGTRSNVDLLEWEYDIAGIEQPTVYDMGTLEECLVSAESLPFSEEGYVIVDSKYNRVKIKSAEYVMAHHLRGNAVTYKRIVEMILSNVSDDFLSIYPEFQPSFDEVWDAIWEYIANLMKESISVPEVKTRKDFAQWALTTSNAGYFFGWLDKKWNDPKQWMWGLTAEKVLEYLELEQ